MLQLLGTAFALALVVAGLLAQTATAGVPQPNCEKIWERSGKGFYENNKPYSDERKDTGVWPTSTPAAENMNATTLDKGYESLKKNTRLRSVLIARHGKLIYEKYPNGGAATQSNNVHSASKSIMQALLGIAIREGYIGSLEDTIYEYLPSSYFSGQPSWKKEITLEELIEMTPGLSWYEEETEEESIAPSTNWVKAIIQQPGAYKPPKSEPENWFNYSTGNTHILSAVLQSATGMSTCTFAGKYLFSDLGIAVEHWGRDPQAVYSGGYNVYMTARELALFGQLYLDNGVWGGKQLVPVETVKQAETRLNHEPEEEEYWYTHGWWSRTISGYDMYFAWGYGGQFVYVIPKLDLLFVTTEDTQGGEKEIESGEFIEKTLIPAVTGP